MITIPVVVDYDNDNVIGTMVIDESKLPKRPNFVFSIGVVLNGKAADKPIELVCVSLQTDEKYLLYLMSDQNKEMQRMFDALEIP